jgi:hypothetical protein
MTIIKRRAAPSIEELANELSDRPYGDKSTIQEDSLSRTTITLPTSMLHKLEDLAQKNKREKKKLKSVSALIRHYIEKHS